MFGLCFGLVREGWLRDEGWHLVEEGAPYHRPSPPPDVPLSIDQQLGRLPSQCSTSSSQGPRLVGGYATIASYQTGGLERAACAGGGGGGRAMKAE